LEFVWPRLDLYPWQHPRPTPIYRHLLDGNPFFIPFSAAGLSSTKIYKLLRDKVVILEEEPDGLRPESNPHWYRIKQGYITVLMFRESKISILRKRSIFPDLESWVE
jgi:hypothetical protein